MKCVHFALLLLLVLTSRTTGVLAADDQATVTGEQRMEQRTLPSLPSPATLRSTLHRSSIRINADETATNVFSAYDMYYASGLYCGDNGENSEGIAEAQVSNSDADDVTTANTAGEPPSVAKLCCDVQRYMSRLATYGRMAAAYASQYWEQAETFRWEQEEKRAEVGEAGVDSSESFDRFAIARRAMLGIPAHLEPVEYLYVASCNNRAILATLGKLTGEYRSGTASHALVGEFYRIDVETCSTLTPTADFAMPWRSNSGETSQDRKDVEQASAPASVATRFEYWAKWWLGDWNVVFRNISRQIARLDWTTLLTGKSGGLAVRYPAAASQPLER